MNMDKVAKKAFPVTANSPFPPPYPFFPRPFARVYAI